MEPRLKRFFQLDWDAIVGIVAAFLALLMHLLHIIEQDVLLAIALVLLALLFIRHLRLERHLGQTSQSVSRIESTTGSIQASLRPPDVVLVGPADLRDQSERFSSRARGEMIWFHVCLSMFRSQGLFDKLLKPAIENPQVTAIRFTLDRSQESLWTDSVVPKVRACQDHGKVQDPTWMTIEENVSFIMAGDRHDGGSECLLSFWGEPFMSQVVGLPVPRYIFHVQPHSELLIRLAELEREHRIKGQG
jgi:hypothetical protein